MRKQTRKRVVAVKPARKAARRTVDVPVDATLRPATKGYVDRELEIIYGSIEQGFRVLQENGRQDVREQTSTIITGNTFGRALGAAIVGCMSMGLSDPESIAVTANDIADAVMSERGRRQLASLAGTAQQAESTNIEDSDLSENEPEEIGL